MLPDVVANEQLIDFNKNRHLKNPKNLVYKDFTMQ